MKVEAMYIGPNGNYKLITGRRYKIKLWVHKDCIYVKRSKKTIIGYTSIPNMLRQWKFADGNGYTKVEEELV